MIGLTVCGSVIEVVPFQSSNQKHDTEKHVEERTSLSMKPWLCVHPSGAVSSV